MTTPFLAVTLIISLIVVARVTRLITIDQITQPLRGALIDRFGEKSQITYLFHCPWCMSIWIAGMLAPVLWWATPVGDTLTGEGINPWMFVPAFVLVASWWTGVTRRLET